MPATFRMIAIQPNASSPIRKHFLMGVPLGRRILVCAGDEIHSAVDSPSGAAAAPLSLNPGHTFDAKALGQSCVCSPFRPS
jgi:hypothetical protein